MKALAKCLVLVAVIGAPFVANAEDGMENYEQFKEHNRQTFLQQKQRIEREQLAKARDQAEKTVKSDNAEENEPES